MKRKYSLFHQLMVILFLFVGMVLGLIYVFQTAFLDDFYSKEKIENINAIARNIENDIWNKIYEANKNKKILY